MSGMGGEILPLKVLFIRSTSSIYGEQYNQIQGKSRYVYIRSLFKNELALVNCRSMENPELKIQIGFKCNDYMIVGFYLNKSLRYSLAPLERVSVPREVCSILTTNSNLEELNRGYSVSLFQLNIFYHIYKYVYIYIIVIITS